MPTNPNSYAKNNYDSYNSGYGKTNRYFINNNVLSYPRKEYPYEKEYVGQHNLTGGEASGSVWVNSSYNLATEDPGVSWVL